MPHLSVALIGDLLKIVVSVMTSISRKDVEQSLLQILPYIRRWIMTLDLATLIDLAGMNVSNIGYILTNTVSTMHFILTYKM